MNRRAMVGGDGQRIRFCSGGTVLALGCLAVMVARLAPIMLFGATRLPDPPVKYTVSGGAVVLLSPGQAEAYQWRFNGAHLPAATNSSLALSNVQLAQAGIYDVVMITNSFSITSAATRLAVSAAARNKWRVRHNADTAYKSVVAIAADNTGNVYLTGTVGAHGTNDIFTAKYDAQGARLWTARYDGSAHREDVPVALGLDGFGNVFVGGSSQNSGGYFDHDYVVVKYDNNGQQLWSSRYDGPQRTNDQAFAMTVDQAGNAYLTGASTVGDFSSAIATVKFGSGGRELWASRHLAPGRFWGSGRAVAVDESGNVYVAGSLPSGEAYTDFVVLKYGADGNLLWIVSDHESEFHNSPAALILGPDDGVYVTGSIGLYQSWRILTAKYDRETGSRLWKTITPGGPLETSPGLLAVDKANNVYVAAKRIVSPVFRPVCYSHVFKLNSEGRLVWTGSRHFGCPTGLAFDQANSLYVADHGLTKYDDNGNVIWSDRFGNVSVLAHDSAGNVYAAGNAFWRDERFTNAWVELHDWVLTAYEQTNIAGYPSIAEPPQSQSVTGGTDATFEVKASGDEPLNYLWFPGLYPNRMISIENVQTNETGDFTVEVFNAKGYVVSPVAHLNVAAGNGPAVSPPIIEGWERDGDSLHFRFHGQPPYDYTVEFTDSLLNSNWLPLTRDRAKIHTIEVVVTNSFSNASMRFFRVRQEPCYCRNN